MKRNDFNRVTVLTYLIAGLATAAEYKLLSWVLLNVFKVRSFGVYMTIGILYWLMRCKMIDDTGRTEWLAYSTKAMWLNDKIFDPIRDKICEMRAR